MPSRTPMPSRTRVLTSHPMHLVAAPEKVFPLLCPVREYDWIETWDCNVVFTRSGFAELDFIFQTEMPGDGGVDTWVVSRYEPPERIEFVRVNALRAMRYSIALTPDGAGGTRAEWAQVITSLNEAGDDSVARTTAEAFATRISGLERMLNHYLRTGTLLSSAPGA